MANIIEAHGDHHRWLHRRKQSYLVQGDRAPSEGDLKCQGTNAQRLHLLPWHLAMHHHCALLKAHAQPFLK